MSKKNVIKLYNISFRYMDSVKRSRCNAAGRGYESDYKYGDRKEI